MRPTAPSTRSRPDRRTHANVAKRFTACASRTEASRSTYRYIAREVIGIIIQSHKQINQSHIVACFFEGRPRIPVPIHWLDGLAAKTCEYHWMGKTDPSLLMVCRQTIAS